MVPRDEERLPYLVSSSTQTSGLRGLTECPFIILGEVPEFLFKFDGRDRRPPSEV